MIKESRRLFVMINNEYRYGDHISNDDGGDLSNVHVLYYKNGAFV